MEISRRAFTATALSSLLLPLPGSAAEAKIHAAYITTGRNHDKSYAAYFLNNTGSILASFPLDARGHGITVSPNAETAVIFARRPGRFAHIISTTSDKPGYIFRPPNNRHFYGHGVFSKDGRLLFATENNFEEEKGVLGIYDATDNFRRLSELSSGGIGPHEVILSKDGKTLIVANGGIATHPDFPRQKLNLPEMQPSISFINVRSGQIEQSFSLPKEFHQISLRHMTADRQGNIWIGGQYQGPKGDEVPLHFKLDYQQRHINPLSAGSRNNQQLKQYIGSVAANRDRSKIAFSAPRGNLIEIWDVSQNQQVKTLYLTDGCGVAAKDTGFFISSGNGTVLGPLSRQKYEDINWDNHMIAL